MNTEVPGNPPLWPQRLFLTAAAATTASCAALGPTEDHSQLPLLRDDPLAAKDLIGLPLIKESEQGYQLRTSKPSHAEILRIFEVDITQKNEIFQAVLNIAQQAGWEDQFPFFPERGKDVLVRCETRPTTLMPLRNIPPTPPRTKHQNHRHTAPTRTVTPPV